MPGPMRLITTCRSIEVKRRWLGFGCDAVPEQPVESKVFYSVKRVGSVFLAVTLIMGLLNLFGCSKKPDLDNLVLIQLKKAGSDLSKPHSIEFFLYFPIQPVAEQAALKTKAAGFNVELEPGAGGSDWLCFATRTMVPDLPALQKIRADFNDLAASLGGKYDGWGIEVVN
jgi:hypothetical protein